MLAQRIATALVLVALLLWALGQLSPWPFALLTLLLMAAAAWEWGRLNQANAVVAIGLGVVVAGAGVAALRSPWAAQAPMAFWWVSAIVWAAAACLVLRMGPSAWARWPQWVRWLVGVLALLSAWLALTNARAVGINFLLSTLCLVWMADVAAYFGGRAWGRRKLAPSVSPGKSWEGVWSGVAAVMLLALVWIGLDRHFGFDGASLYTRLFQALGWAGLAVALLALSAFSVIGDLIESLVKRAAGAKDSSRLLPGHGGVFDRVDALLPVMPLALALSRLSTP